MTEWWGVAGTWFTGVANVFVASVALYLAYGPERVRLSIIPYGVDTTNTDKAYFKVVNIGKRRVTITGANWQRGTWWTGLEQIYPLGLPNLPFDLYPGQEGEVLIGLPRKLLASDKWRLQLYTSSGKTKKLLLGDEAIRFLQENRITTGSSTTQQSSE